MELTQWSRQYLTGVMTALKGGLVPTPPNDANYSLDGTGVFSSASIRNEAGLGECYRRLFRLWCLHINHDRKFDNGWCDYRLPNICFDIFRWTRNKYRRCWNSRRRTFNYYFFCKYSK